MEELVPAAEKASAEASPPSSPEADASGGEESAPAQSGGDEESDSGVRDAEGERTDSEPAHVVSVAGGHLEAVLAAAKEKEGKEGKALQDPATAADAAGNGARQKAYLDAIMAAGGRLPKKAKEGGTEPKPRGRKTAWRYLVPGCVALTREQADAISDPAALRALIEHCIERPAGRASVPTGGRGVVYLRNILVRAVPKPSG